MSSPHNNTPDHNPLDEQLERRARELWLEAARHLDPATAARLRAVRREACETGRAPGSHTARWLIPTGAFAVIALATLMVWQPLPLPHATTAMQNTADASADLDNELPPDADKTDPNLYQNLDFYGWLAANNSATANR